jgi:hypothetical protein
MALKFTATQQRILDVLADGQPHARKELWACIPSAEGIEDPKLLQEYARCQANRHLVAIRSKLRAVGEDIVCVVVNRRMCYRHVKLLWPDQPMVSELPERPDIVV